jgi:hypothetical protein
VQLRFSEVALILQLAPNCCNDKLENFK